MTTPPTKRQRPENASIMRSDIWYQDGSVILQAENTQFRVYWGILSQHSSFFREMQGLPQPPEQVYVDGCPVIEMQDSAADVAHLLKALHNPTFLQQAALPLPVVAALIRLGRKYEFRELLDSAVARLTFENPTTLAEYDARIDPSGFLGYVPTRIINYNGLIFDMLTVARENNILSALPCAYYRAACSGHGRLLDGIKNRDGTLASLTSVEQRQCILGGQKLLIAQTQPGYTMGWLRSWVPAAGCTQRNGCTTVRNICLHRYLDSGAIWALDSYTELYLEFCDACRPPNEAAVRVGREEMWEDLPGFFDLPRWNELKNDL
ncbi:hypothetical protein FB451DRAFT_207902 [Mycena latifolia]|nr:hypothetical protein FB451DRAFT_207902 [Mycena latifolia]